MTFELGCCESDIHTVETMLLVLNSDLSQLSIRIQLCLKMLSSQSIYEEKQLVICSVLHSQAKMLGRVVEFNAFSTYLGYFQFIMGLLEHYSTYKLRFVCMLHPSVH